MKAHIQSHVKHQQRVLKQFIGREISFRKVIIQDLTTLLKQAEEAVLKENDHSSNVENETIHTAQIDGVAHSYKRD